MSFGELCYGHARDDSRKGMCELSYSLEEAGQEIGTISCKREPQDEGSKFLFEAEGYSDIRWTCESVEHSREGVLCRIVCPDLDWEFSLRFPRQEAATLFAFENGWELSKKQTRFVWGPGSFYVVDPDGNEHPWAIAFDTGCMAALLFPVRLLTLGLFPKHENENWIVGSASAKQLPIQGQQKLAIVNATFRMELLPNDFSSGG